MNLGGLHPITGRQWELADEQPKAIWPDACLVVPFGAQVADTTGKVINPVAGKSVQGGWTVTSTLERLELTDLVQHTKVAGVTAVWAAGPGGGTPALHLLGDNPFAWLTPHLDVAASASTTAYPLRDQWFGPGPAQLSTGARRFGELVVKPAAGAHLRLVPAPLAWVTERMLQSPGAGLSFSRPDGSPIVVDQLWLGVLLHGREELHFFARGHVDELIPLPGGWRYALLRVDVGTGAHSVEIPYPGAILWVRYRHQALRVSTPERVTLKPGHYELTLSGTTTGKAPSSDFQDAADVHWSATQRFWVEHPPSLRPYVHFSTLGDNRLFGTVPGFDPTLPGVGFPAHRDYLPVVRFCVPYVKGMFPKLMLRLIYPDAPEISESASVVTNGQGESALPAAAVDWKTAHGGIVPPDDETVMTAAVTPGAAALHIRHQPAAGPEFELDSWGVHISRFTGAGQHLAWPGTCITRYFRPDGPHDHAACSTLAKPPWHPAQGVRPAALRAHDVHAFELGTRDARAGWGLFSESIAGRLLHPIVGVGTAMPDEYGSPPDDWSLPASLASLAMPLDSGAAQRFLLFLWRSTVRLSADVAAAALAGVGDPIAATTVEAVCDDQDRPLALWLRTPEPIDWRRVHAGITLRHVTGDTGCPTAYANRHTMALTVDLLPSTDGSSALLVARLAGTPTRIPRGEITLQLTYDPKQNGLVALRPRTPLPSGHETVTLTFLQPLGRTWPVKPADDGVLHFPHVPIGFEHPPRVGPPLPHPWDDLVAPGHGVLGPHVGPGPAESTPLSDLLQVQERQR